MRDELKAADITFCQLEVNITERGERLPQCRHTHRAAASTGAAMAQAGFDIVSCAGNHCMDWGRDGFEDTLDNLRRAGLAVVGVGSDLDAARRPVIIERKGWRVAVLAYNSILPMGYWATPNRAGCAPLRAFTLYEQIEPDQPGTPARVRTWPHPDDLSAMQDDVQQARTRADIVLVSMHWGLHFTPAVLADYQREAGRAAIDAGADAVIGHHAHILKGVEIHRGKPIFYSLCNFAMDLRMDAAHASSEGFREIQSLHPHWVPDFESLYNFPDDSRMTGAVRITASADGQIRVGFRPAFVNRQAQPEFLAPSDPRFEQVRAYLADMSRAAGLTTRFEVAGDEVVAWVG